MNVSKPILIVEDDTQIRKFIEYLLKNDGFNTKSAENGKTALSILISEPIELVILDLGLPDIDGIEIIKKLREWSDIPIIVVSARDQDKEKAFALDLGADDYLTKPFSATELSARIRVALRHITKESSQKKKFYKVKDLSIDFEKRLVYLKGIEIHTTPMEYNLLSLFFNNIGKVLTTKYIIKELWGVGYGNDTQALRTLMAGLRRKIEENPAKPKYISTEIGVGYRLVE